MLQSLLRVSVMSCCCCCWSMLRRMTSRTCAWILCKDHPFRQRSAQYAQRCSDPYMPSPHGLTQRASQYRNAQPSHITTQPRGPGMTTPCAAIASVVVGVVATPSTLTRERAIAQVQLGGRQLRCDSAQPRCHVGGGGGSSSSNTFKKPSAPTRAYLRPITDYLLHY